MKTMGVLLFFTGIFILALAYTMALQGVYVGCLGGGAEGLGCGLRFYGEPTVSSALYGTFLGAAAMMTYRVGLETLLWMRQAGVGRFARAGIF